MVEWIDSTFIKSLKFETERRKIESAAKRNRSNLTFWKLKEHVFTCQPGDGD